MNGNLSQGKGLLSSLGSEELENIKEAVSERLGESLDKKVDKDEVYTKDEIDLKLDSKVTYINISAVSGMYIDGMYIDVVGEKTPSEVNALYTSGGIVKVKLNLSELGVGSDIFVCDILKVTSKGDLLFVGTDGPDMYYVVTGNMSNNTWGVAFTESLYQRDIDKLATKDDIKYFPTLDELHLIFLTQIQADMTYASKEEVGDIAEATAAIIALQNKYIGGGEA